MLEEDSDVLVEYDGATKLLLIDEMPLAGTVVAAVDDVVDPVELGEEMSGTVLVPVCPLGVLIVMEMGAVVDGGVTVAEGEGPLLGLLVGFGPPVFWKQPGSVVTKSGENGRQEEGFMNAC